MGVKIFIVIRWLVAISLLLSGILVKIQSQDTNFIPTLATVIESNRSYGLTASEDRLPATHFHFGYQYSFLSKEYLSKRVTHGYSNQALGVEQFQKGTSLQVYVNPDNPEYSVIDKGMPIVFYLMIFAGICMLANLLLEARITHFDKKNLDRPEWLQNAFNLTGPLAGVLFLTTAVMLFL